NWSSASRRKAMTGSAKRSPPVSESASKPGAHRVATLNSGLAGRGAGGARLAYEALELPYWRRSGFWQTSFEDLDLDALAPRTHAPDATLPALLAGQRNAGVLVQRD